MWNQSGRRWFVLTPLAALGLDLAGERPCQVVSVAGAARPLNQP